jgi:hypothetical protein
MNTDGAMMPTVETNLETVRNPTEFIRGRMSGYSIDAVSVGKGGMD